MFSLQELLWSWCLFIATKIFTRTTCLPGGRMTSWWDTFRADGHDPSRPSGRPDRPLNLNECALSRLNWKSHVQGTVLTEGSGAAQQDMNLLPFLKVSLIWQPVIGWTTFCHLQIGMNKLYRWAYSWTGCRMLQTLLGQILPLVKPRSLSKLIINPGVRVIQYKIWQN